MSDRDRDRDSEVETRPGEVSVNAYGWQENTEVGVVNGEKDDDAEGVGEGAGGGVKDGWIQGGTDPDGDDGVNLLGQSHVACGNRQLPRPRNLRCKRMIHQEVSANPHVSRKSKNDFQSASIYTRGAMKRDHVAAGDPCEWDRQQRADMAAPTSNSMMLSALTPHLSTRPLLVPSLSLP